MDAVLQVRSLTLGSGQPKIIVPIVGKTEEEILRAAQEIAAHPLVDLAEWRVDYYECAPDVRSVSALLPRLRAALQNKPLLFTFLTAREGGMQTILPEQYIALCEGAAASGQADLIDVEMFFSEAAKSVLMRVHACGVPVVGSWHNFAETPGQDEINSRLRTIEKMGADVLKVAVMPNNLADVDHLMNAARTMHKKTSRPLCAISMGDTGAISRIGCRYFGGCMTFGTLSGASAPGQINVNVLHLALQRVG